MKIISSLVPVSPKAIIKKVIIPMLIACLLVGIWFVRSEIHSAEAQQVDSLTFTVQEGESAAVLAARLEDEQVIRHAGIFRWYLSRQGLDTRIHPGEYTVAAPITIANVAEALREGSAKKERQITIIPGWTLRDIAAYLLEQNIIADEQDLYTLVGESAVQNAGQVTFSESYRILGALPKTASLEGYLAPDTFRIFVDEDLEQTLERLVKHRDSQVTDQMHRDIAAAGRTLHDVMTIASMLEKEVPREADMAKVADLFWRRLDAGWGMQADSTVHYIFGKKGDLFTSKEERDSTNPWNTYKYAGLPPGPIATPSVEAIRAAIYPKKNDAWYFLTTLDTGEVKYGRSFEEHTANIQRYLR